MKTIGLEGAHDVAVVIPKNDQRKDFLLWVRHNLPWQQLIAWTKHELMKFGDKDYRLHFILIVLVSCSIDLHDEKLYGLHLYIEVQITLYSRIVNSLHHWSDFVVAPICDVYGLSNEIVIEIWHVL